MADLSRRSRPVASIGQIVTGARRALGISIRESDRRHYVEVRGLALKDEDCVPTDRAVTCPVADLRAMRRLLEEADRKAVALGLLPEGGAV